MRFAQRENLVGPRLGGDCGGGRRETEDDGLDHSRVRLQASAV